MRGIIESENREGRKAEKGGWGMRERRGEREGGRE